jgi:lipoprotein-anchoring transpeptidase ErfK/SrfK
MKRFVIAARLLLAIAVLTVGQIALVGNPASAASTAPPQFLFVKNMNDPLNSRLSLYYSNAGVRRVITVRAGSGNGSTDDCVRNKGFLPDGTYPARFYPNYPGTSPIVRGDVWYLGAKPCWSGKVTRSELFIHSSGVPGSRWTGYVSNGCIKVMQADRARLAAAWRSAANNGSGTLIVRS